MYSAPIVLSLFDERCIVTIPTDFFLEIRERTYHPEPKTRNCVRQVRYEREPPQQSCVRRRMNGVIKNIVVANRTIYRQDIKEAGEKHTS
jgi:hypothetical protein